MLGLGLHRPAQDDPNWPPGEIRVLSCVWTEITLDSLNVCEAYRGMHSRDPSNQKIQSTIKLSCLSGLHRTQNGIYQGPEPFGYLTLHNWDFSQNPTE